jgi:hypothetical protein
MTNTCDLCEKADDFMCGACEYEMDIEMMQDLAIGMQKLLICDPEITVKYLTKTIQADSQLQGGPSDCIRLMTDVLVAIHAMQSATKAIDALLGINSLGLMVAKSSPKRGA